MKIRRGYWDFRILGKDLSLGVGQYYDKVNKDNHQCDNIQNNIGIIHNLSFFYSSYSPQIDNQSKYSRQNIKGKKVHNIIFALLANLAETIKNNEAIAMPITNVNQAILPEACGINAPTTSEPNIIFAPSRKKSDTVFSSSFDNIRLNFNTRDDFVKYFIS